jgi:EAL domain-containing protein (putative c-di-GMP-specific phosphodiesterase class I)
MKLQYLQKEINIKDSGYCILIKILNEAELDALTQEKYSFINDLNNIIHQIMLEYKDDFSLHKLDNKILLILPIIDNKFLEELMYKIYSSTQLYEHPIYDWCYFNCIIASIEFPKFANNIENILNILEWLSSIKIDNLYYRNYDSKIYNLAFIKQQNINVNLFRKSLKMRNAIFAYQPIICAKDYSIDHYECLLRIPDKENNYISIGPIIAEAEIQNLNYYLDQVVLEMAIKELYLCPNLILAVNISNKGILNKLLLDLAINLLKKYAVGNRLMIEITETSINNNFNNVNEFIFELRKYQCKFALDDFGSGFTSFTQLKNLKIDVIKIDGAYVRDILTNSDSQYFVKKIVDIGEKLNLDIVAEFVENELIEKKLLELGVKMFQGNYFGAASLRY